MILSTNSYFYSTFLFENKFEVQRFFFIFGFICLYLLTNFSWNSIDLRFLYKDSKTFFGFSAILELIFEIFGLKLKFYEFFICYFRQDYFGLISFMIFREVLLILGLKEKVYWFFSSFSFLSLAKVSFFYCKWESSLW